jgi:hypothetical protein
VLIRLAQSSRPNATDHRAGEEDHP